MVEPKNSIMRAYAPALLGGLALSFLFFAIGGIANAYLPQINAPFGAAFGFVCGAGVALLEKW